MSEALVSVKNISKTFSANKGMFGKKKFVHAVNDVSFDIMPGETFSLVGESGCGKSTTGKLIDHLITPDTGEIWFEGKDISKISDNEMRPLRSDIQMVFQDPYSALNPQKKIYSSFEEPLKTHGITSQEEREKMMQRVLKMVNIQPDYLLLQLFHRKKTVHQAIHRRYHSHRLTLQQLPDNRQPLAH